MLKVALLTRQTLARRDAPFSIRRSHSPSSLRPCRDAILSILHGPLPLFRRADPVKFWRGAVTFPHFPRFSAVKARTGRCVFCNTSSETRCRSFRTTAESLALNLRILSRPGQDTLRANCLTSVDSHGLVILLSECILACRLFCYDDFYVTRPTRLYAGSLAPQSTFYDNAPRPLAPPSTACRSPDRIAALHHRAAHPATRLLPLAATTHNLPDGSARARP